MHDPATPDCLICMTGAENHAAGILYYIPGSQAGASAHQNCIDQWFSDPQHKQLNNVSKEQIEREKIPYSNHLQALSDTIARARITTHNETKLLITLLETVDEALLQNFVSTKDLSQIEWNAYTLTTGNTLCALVAGKIQFIESFYQNERFMTAFLSWILSAPSNQITSAVFNFFGKHPECLERRVNGKNFLHQALKKEDTVFKNNLHDVLRNNRSTKKSRFFSFYLSLLDNKPSETDRPLNINEWKEYIHFYGHPVTELIALSVNNPQSALEYIDTLKGLLASGMPYEDMTADGTLLQQAAIANHAAILNILLTQFVTDMKTRAHKGEHASVGIYLLLINKNGIPLWRMGDDACKNLVKALFLDLGIILTPNQQSLEVLEALSQLKKPKTSSKTATEMEEALLAEDDNALLTAVLEDLQNLGYLDKKSAPAAHTAITRIISQRNQAMYRTILYDFLIACKNESEATTHTPHWRSSDVAIKIFLNFLGFFGIIIGFCVVANTAYENDYSEDYSTPNTGSIVLNTLAGAMSLGFIATFNWIWEYEIRWLRSGRSDALLLELAREQIIRSSNRTIDITTQPGAGLTEAQSTAINALLDKETIATSEEGLKKLPIILRQYQTFLQSNADENLSSTPAIADYRATVLACKK